MAADLSPDMETKDQSEIFDPESFTFKRAFKDEKEVIDVITRLIQDVGSKERIRKAALIAERWNDAPVFDEGQLKAAGQDWRHKDSSGWFSSLVKRAHPAYMNVIKGLPVLTEAKLRDATEMAESKSQKFRERFTTTVRRWEGWERHTSQTSLENLIYGYATNGYTDEIDWRPKFWRIDETFFPEGTAQDAKDVPYWCAKEDFVIHQLASKLAQPALAKEAGWNIPNLIESVNEAQPKHAPFLPEDQRRAEDRIRESTTIQSYQNGVKVVEGVHCFFQEPDGSVSYVLIDWIRKHALLTRRNLFSGMTECLTLFSIEIGNGKIHGSKGMGRVLYNTALQAEQARCVLKDTVYLGALFLLKRTTKATVQAALTVVFPAAIVNQDYEVEDNKLSVAAQAFYELDEHFTEIAELQTGQFMPAQLLDQEGEKPTARQVSYVATVENEIKTGILARFFSQVMELVYMMQKRMFSVINIEQAVAVLAWEDAQGQNGSEDPRVTAFRERIEKKMLTMARFKTMMSQTLQKIGLQKPPTPRPIVNDEEAVKTICDLIREDGLSPVEVYELGLCKPNSDMPGDPQEEAQTMAEVLQLFINDPDVDKYTLKRMYLERKVGVDDARIILLPGIDKTVIEEQSRLQMMELTTMMQGVSLPVSPRDSHLVHLQVLESKAQQFIQQIASIPPAALQQTLAIAQNVMGHYQQHLMAAKADKNDKKAIAPFEQFAKVAGTIIQKAQQALAEFQAAQQAALPQAQGTIPPVGAGSLPQQGSPMPPQSQPSLSPSPAPAQ